MGAHKDKEMVDKIIRKIEEEDYTDYMERTNKVKNTKAVIEAYKRQREEEVRKAAWMAKEAEDKILQYAQAKNAREATFKAAQDQRKAEEEMRFKKIEEDMRLKREEEEEFARLRDMLWEEETEARLRSAERAKQEKQEQAKMDMMEANEQQKVLKRQIIMQREEKQMLYQQEKDAEAEARRRVQEEEAFKLKVVEAARQRLLAQHAHVVSGFAPK